MSYSGSLNDSINKADIIPTDRTMQGEVWFFSENQAGAGRGVEFSIECRVFKLREGAKVSDSYYRHLNPWHISKLKKSNYDYQYSAEDGHHKTAFRSRHELKQWLKLTGLKIHKRGHWGLIWLKGTFSQSSEMMNREEFFAKFGHLEPFPALSNGYHIGFKEVIDGKVILHSQRNRLRTYCKDAQSRI